MLQVILLAAQLSLGQSYEVTVGHLPPRYTVTVGTLPPRTDKDPYPKGYWRPEWPQPKWEPLETAKPAAKKPPQKYNPATQPQFQEKMNRGLLRRREVYYTTPLIAPRYRAANC